MSEVELVFGMGPRRRGLVMRQRVWLGGEAAEPLPLVEIAAIGGLEPAATCHVVLHELAHVLAPGFGHGREWRFAARQVGLLNPRAWPDAWELDDWAAISPAIRGRCRRSRSRRSERRRSTGMTGTGGRAERGMGPEGVSAEAKGRGAAT